MTAGNPVGSLGLQALWTENPEIQMCSTANHDRHIPSMSTSIKNLGSLSAAQALLISHLHAHVEHARELELRFWKQADCMSCSAMYHTIPYHAILCESMPYYAILCHNVLRCTIRYHVIPYDTIRYHAIPYDTVHIQCHAILYRWNVLHHTVLDYTTPCHAIPY